MVKLFDNPLTDYLLVIFGLAGLLSMVYLFLSFSVNVIPAGTCSIYGTPLNCEAVNASTYSSVFGVKLYFYGIAFFALMTVLSVLHAVSMSRRRVIFLRSILFIFSLLASIAALYLIYLEVFQIGAICPMCTIGHAAIFLLLAFSFIEVQPYLGPARRFVKRKLSL